MSKFKVDGWNNFCRIFELPSEFSNNYCFGSGIDTNFKMIDWFSPVTIGDGFQPAVPKEVWKENVGEIEIREVSLDELQNNLIEFLSKKQYLRDDKKYLFLSDFGATFLYNKDGILKT